MLWRHQAAAASLVDLIRTFDTNYLIDQGLVSQADDKLEVVQSEVLWSLAAEGLAAEIAENLSNTNKLFELLRVAWAREIGKPSKVAGRALALLHNSNQVDMFGKMKDLLSNGFRVFDVLHLAEAAVSFANQLEAQAVLAFEEAYVDLVKNDMASGMLQIKMVERFKTHIEEARNLVVAHHARPIKQTEAIFSSAIQGLAYSSFDEAFALSMGDAISECMSVARPAMHALGRMISAAPTTTEIRNKAIALLAARYAAIEEDSKFASAHALIEASERELAALQRSLLLVANSDSPSGWFAVSNFMCFSGEKHFDEKWFHDLLLLLAKVPSDKRGILDNIDSVLTKMIETPALHLIVIRYLDDWILTHRQDAADSKLLFEIFDSTFYELIKHSDLLATVLTSWLVHNDKLFPICASRFSQWLSAHQFDKLLLDSHLIADFGVGDYQFLLRRIKRARLAFLRDFHL